MLREDNTQRWGVNTCVPSGTVRGVKRKAAVKPKFKAKIVNVKTRTKTAVLFVPNRYRPWSKDRTEKLFELKESGKTWKEIAAELGTTQDAVRKRWKRCLIESAKKILD